MSPLFSICIFLLFHLVVYYLNKVHIICPNECFTVGILIYLIMLPKIPLGLCYNIQYVYLLPFNKSENFLIPKFTRPFLQIVDLILVKEQIRPL